MTLPKVSIVIPSYKTGHFEQCLKSAIGQTYSNIEILVSDNCATEEIRNISAQYPSVIYQRNSQVREKNVLSAFFSGKGEYIKPLFDDDILHPFCVERMVAVMTMRSDIELVFSASQVINADNERTKQRRPYEASGYLTGRDLQRSMALGMRNIVGEFSSIMFRREKLWEIGWQRLFMVGKHDFTLGLADVAAYCNLAADGAAFYIDEELSYFRHDQRLQSNSNPDSNPNFGYCFSDYIDLLIASHQGKVITTTELLEMQESVMSVNSKLREMFEQVGHSYERYLAYTGKLIPD